MRSLLISSILLGVTVIFIIINAAFIHNFSTDLLDLAFSLPSGFENITSMSPSELEECKSVINTIEKKWNEKFYYISLISKYDETEKTGLTIGYMKEFFFCGEYAKFLTERRNFISKVEKQKLNELPKFENIF